MINGRIANALKKVLETQIEKQTPQLINLQHR